MIRLDVKPWCENCNEFEAEVSKFDYEDFQDNRVTDTVIKCAHAQRCESIRKYLAEKGE